MHRPVSWRIATILGAFTIILAYLLWLGHDDLRSFTTDPISAFEDDGSPSVFLEKAVACSGPRGYEVSSYEQSALDEIQLDNVPLPYAGSYKELGLTHTFSTAIDRYGPYGFEEDWNGNRWQKVDWGRIDWASLQNKCLKSNARSNYTHRPISSTRKMSFRGYHDRGRWFSRHVPPRQKHTTGRTAIIVRGYSTFSFTGQDLWNLRALITETSLRYAGRYSVYLLIDVKGDFDVMHNPEHYESVLTSIPTEFQNMTILFDQKYFLKAWYPMILEHRPEFQMEQARQLFAQHFPEFDHYWQIELDVRFTGDAGHFLGALEEFARNEPRKQARERASFSFLPEVHGTYRNFRGVVNEALGGGSTFWHGVKIPDLEQIGPTPPVPTAEADDFEWGVGEEADIIILSSTMNITLNRDWVYRDWIFNFAHGVDTPRVSSAPAISRCSWNLLNAIHDAQLRKGLRIPSEATPISWALWHNLKISRPPLPIYGQSAHLCMPKQIDMYLNGGPPSAEHDGMAWGQNSYGDLFGQDSGVKDLGPTWRWDQGYPSVLMEVWLANDVDRVSKLGADVPTLQDKDGKVCMPNLMLHPVKTNMKAPANLPRT